MEKQALPADVLFHRFFQDCVHPPNKAHYTGKLVLERLADTLLAGFLARIQTALNESLARTRETLPTLGVQLQFHFDYIDADVANALAFRYGGYAFIGITMPLIQRLIRISTTLSANSDVAGVLKLSASGRESSAGFALFTVQELFVASHEFGHHVFGHTSECTERVEFWNEVVLNQDDGSIEDQARETQADSYGVYLVLNQLIDTPQRRNILDMLGHSELSEVEANEVLLSLFILSIGSYLFVQSPQAVNAENIYSFTHPPQAARMNSIMQTVETWCNSRYPSLTPWVTHAHFNRCMAAVGEATLDMNGGGKNWDEQTSFFSSEQGAQYFSSLSTASANLHSAQSS